MIYDKIKRKVYFHYIYSIFSLRARKIYTIIIVARVVLCICHLLTDIKWSQVHQQDPIQL
jgi:hypothetical protein